MWFGYWNPDTDGEALQSQGEICRALVNIWTLGMECGLEFGRIPNATINQLAQHLSAVSAIFIFLLRKQHRR